MFKVDQYFNCLSKHHKMRRKKTKNPCITINKKISSFLALLPRIRVE